MDHAHEPEQDLLGSITSRWEPNSFGDVLAVAEQIGTNKGDRRVIDLYRTWIALHGAGGQFSHAAWFNLGAEWSHAGEPQNAMLAYRAALASRPDFSPASINLGLLLEQQGEPQMALACWSDALQKDAARIALLNQRARLLEELGQLADAEAAMQASLTIQPGQPDVIQHWLHVRQRMCLWPILSDAVRALSPDDLMASCGPLAALALTGIRWPCRPASPVPGLSGKSYRHPNISRPEKATATTAYVSATCHRTSAGMP